MVGPRSLGVALLTAGFVGMVFTIQVLPHPAPPLPPVSKGSDNEEDVFSAQGLAVYSMGQGWSLKAYVQSQDLES
jgi:hypothetical protein